MTIAAEQHGAHGTHPAGHEQAGTTGMVLPPGPSLPRWVQGAIAMANRRRALQVLRRRYGDAFTVELPIFGSTLVLSDPDEVRALFRTGVELADNLEHNLGRVLGSNSMFALTDDRHRRHRRLLLPPFHGRRLGAYERLVEELTVEEMATWPEDRPFATLPSMMRITLNVILRAVFGAEGEELEQLRRLLPPMVRLGSFLANVPLPPWRLHGLSPWDRFQHYRDQYDDTIDSLLDRARADPHLDDRNDVLALMLQARDEDGSGLERDEIADQLATLLSAGHETTATTLAWAVERLRRNPAVLARLVEDLDAGEHAYLDATITEVQRSRPVIDLTARAVRVDGVQVGRWTIPKGHSVLAAIGLIHQDAAVFADPERFDPGRFLDAGPETFTGVAFGGGTRRCIGAAFAQMEMRVVLRTMLRDLTLVPTGERPERWHSRGVAYAPGKGGRAVIRRRSPAA
jgi:cytochrome P450